MPLKISHRTVYSYDAPVPYALQRVRLQPHSGSTQTVVSWSVEVEGANEEVRFHDQFGNDTRLLSVSGEAQSIEITASGEVEVRDTAGVTGPHTGFAPLWLFERPTSLTTAGPLIGVIARSVEGADDLSRMHALSGAIR